MSEGKHNYILKANMIALLREGIKSHEAKGYGHIGLVAGWRENLAELLADRLPDNTRIYFSYYTSPKNEGI